MQRLWGDFVALLASVVEECEGMLATSIGKDSGEEEGTPSGLQRAPPKP